MSSADGWVDFSHRVVRKPSFCRRGRCRKPKQKISGVLADLKARDWHLATGFIGTPLLLPAGLTSPLRFLGHAHRIAKTWGPERIETGWWRRQAVGRDYYRVETVTGRRFWIFRNLRDGRWFLHGMFE